MKFLRFDFYRNFLDGMPVYLARHYWWAYLWPRAVWFFDHQPIINAILFGQYKKLMQATLEELEDAPKQRVLQLTCVYGELTGKIMEAISPSPLHIADVALIQLEFAQRKAKNPSALKAVRMNAENLAYHDDSFTTLVLFFLLHEMPKSARNNVLSECMRVIPDGGVLQVTEYAPLPTEHFLYRFWPSRWLTTYLEPFLGDFWHDDITQMLNTHGASFGKKASIETDQRLFGNFYRVTKFKISSLEA